MGGSGDGFGWEVELCIIGVAMEVEAVAAEDLSQGEDVHDKKEGAKHRALGNSVGYGSGGGFRVVYGDELLSVREI